MRVIGYVRVSTKDQAELGVGLLAQRASIEGECARRGWELVEIFEDAGASGKSMEREAIEAALVELKARRAEGLVVAKLDRLSRSLQDFVGLMATAKKQGWVVVAIDLGIDTSTTTGRLVANIMASVAEWEREVIGTRTKEGLAAKKAQGKPFGRISLVDVTTRERIQAERLAGKGYRAIASGLNDDKVKTGHGGVKWYASTVRAVSKLAA